VVGVLQMEESRHDHVNEGCSRMGLRSDLDAYGFEAFRSIICANFDQMIIGIIQVKSWRGTSGAGLNARTQVITD
jgi:hypothetical protein